MSDARSDLPNVSAANFQQRLRETVQTYLGRQGDPLDRGLTLRDLLDAGIVTIKDGFSLRSGSSSLPLAPASPVASVAPAYELDLTPPPQPTGFTAVAAISHVLVEHAVPTYTQGHGHLRTHLYGATWVSGPLPTFDDAVEIAQFSGPVYALPSNPSTTWHLWIKWESADGVLSATPAGGTNGVVAVTGQDVASLLDALTGQITSGELHSSLGERIDLIDAPTTGLVARAIALESQISSVQADVAALSGTPDYDNTATYAVDDIVKYSGGLYRAKLTTTGNLPTNNTYWQKIGDYASLGDAVAAHAALLDDHGTRITATESGLAAEVSARTTLGATVASNTSAISSEATARANADAALSSTISSVSAVANSKSKTYLQAAAPASGMTAGDLWYDSDDNNKSYRYSGSAWVLTEDPRTAQNAAAIATETTARANGDTALASQITALTATVGSNTAAISSEASVRAAETGELYAKYTVKVDLAGHVSGYGLASTANNGAVVSQFGVRADQFFVAPPSVSSETAPASPYKNMVWYDTTTSTTKYYTGSAWTTTPQALPFVVQTVPQVINGETVEPGVYMDNVFMRRLVATRGQIGLLAVDDARIADVSADKLTAGTIDVGQYIQGTGYVAGSAGWRINGDGTAEFSNAVIRGTGQFSGTILGGIATGFGAGIGFFSGGDDDANYKWRVGNPAGARIQWTGTAVEVYNASNQLTMSSGGISAAFVTGLGSFATLNSITAANIGTYIANAAIDTAQIKDAAVTAAKIGSIALVGTNNFSVKSALSGARMEMDSRVIKVYDASGVLRVKIGDLTA